eukprot:7829488-Lingulodinium_polyedra.AAC.1
MQDVVDQLPVHGDCGPEVVEELRRYGRLLYTGFGQTKLVEDANGEVRDTEVFTTKNKALRPLRMWHALRSRNILRNHGRQEVQKDDAAAAEGEPVKADEAFFSSRFHEPGVDLEGITKRRTWPSWTAESSKGLSSMRVLLEHLFDHDRWAVASSSWLSVFLESGGVIWDTKNEEYLLHLGNVGRLASLVWPLE